MPIDTSELIFSTTNLSIRFTLLSYNDNVSPPEEILKLVWRLAASNPNISGGFIPKLLSGLFNDTLKKGIIVKSEEVFEMLWAWTEKIFSPSFNISSTSDIVILSGLPPLYIALSWSVKGTALKEGGFPPIFFLPISIPLIYATKASS